MKTLNITLLALTAATMLSCTSHKPKAEEQQQTLAQAFEGKFLMGVAVNQWQVAAPNSKEAQLAIKQFNSIVAENCMKCEVIHPSEDRYDFTLADEFVDFGLRNNMAIIGHCLIWHSQCAPWFFIDDKGNQVSADVLKQRMKDHITTIVSHYKGKILGWDVVNEAIEGDGSYRKSKFYEILGEEYIPYAFQCAYEADSTVQLYYNDFGMNMPAKRATVVKLINDLKARGLRIDAVGMQSHMGMDYPNFQEFEESIEAYAATGVNVMFTELDMSALPTIDMGANVSDTVAYQQMLNPYTEGLPDSVSTIWNSRMDTVFAIALRHADVITRITAWGVTDADSWKNDWPMKGRKEYPLLFDRNCQPKPFLTKYLTKNN